MYYTVPWCVPQWGVGEFVATAECLLPRRIVLGAHARRFPEAVKHHLGRQYAIAANRGRTAIYLALRGMNVDERDQVILPSYVCGSVLNAVRNTGARPVFADVGPDLHVTCQTVSDALTDRTRCVIVPHLFGNTAPIDAIERMLAGSGVFLIDDAAQSFGARCGGRAVGTFGDCGVVSCGPGKALAGAAGGVLVTNNQDLYRRAATIELRGEPAFNVATRVISFWFWRRFRAYTRPGEIVLNRLGRPRREPAQASCAMSNLDAAIALCQLNRLDETTAERRSNAARLLHALGPWARFAISDLADGSAIVKIVLVLPPASRVWIDELISALRQGGVECQRGYTPLHLQHGGSNQHLPVTNALWDRVLCIPTQTRLRAVWRLSYALKPVNAALSACSVTPSVSPGTTLNTSGGICC